MTRARDLAALVFGPDEYTPVRYLWALLVAALLLPFVGWLVRNDEPNDLSTED